ncbi:MAG: S8 family serine peptidase [Bacteroidota bacterium]
MLKSLQQILPLLGFILSSSFLHAQFDLTATPEVAARLSASGAAENQKVWGELLQFEKDFTAHIRSGDLRRNFQPTIQGVSYYQDQVRIEVAAKGAISTTIAELAELGATDFHSAGHIIDAWLPADKISDLRRLESVQFAHGVYEPIMGVGSVTSEGDAGQVTDLLRINNGVSGASVKVGIMSDSYNTLGGASTGILSGDLPGPSNPFGRTTPVNVLLEYSSTGTDEGRGMAEIVHDVAPDAEMAFHTAFGGIATFADGIRALAADGCNIIVDDVRYFTSPMYQDGILSVVADSVVDEGIVYLTSAGNQGDESYESAYSSTAYGSAWYGKTYPDYHSFASGQPWQDVQVAAGATVTIILQWNEPFFSVSGAPGASSDYDILLINSAGTTIIGGANSYNTGSDPVEIATYTNTSGTPETIKIWLLRYSGSTSVQLKTVLLSGTYQNFDTQSGTAFGQSNAENVLSVGAVFYANTPAYGVTTPILESFSSKGGIPIYFDENGTSLGASGVVRQKPDIISVDGANTTFFGSDIAFDPDAYPNFFGTSASAPHAAASVALILEQFPSLTPAEVETYIQNNSVSMGTVGFDYSNAFGMANFNAAFNDIAASLPVTLASFQATARENQVLLSWETEVEENVASFFVETSKDGHQFDDVKIIDPKGSGSFYQTEITNLTTGWHHFRVRFEDIDGTITYSPSRRVQIDATDVAPQVSVLNQTESFTFYWGGDLNDYQLELFDLSGRQLGSWSGTGNSVQLNKDLFEGHFLIYKLNTRQGGSVKRWSGKLNLR